MRMWVRPLALLTGSSVAVSCEQMRLGSHAAVTVVEASGCISDLTPSMGTSTCCECIPKKKTEKNKVLNLKVCLFCSHYIVGKAKNWKTYHSGISNYCSKPIIRFSKVADITDKQMKFWYMSPFFHFVILINVNEKHQQHSSQDYTCQSIHSKVGYVYRNEAKNQCKMLWKLATNYL